jgi:hypothetical protein
MKISLTFMKPELVSALTSDSLTMHLLRPEIFLIGAEGLTRKRFTSQRNVPKQTATSVADTAEATAEAS